jgi:3'-5' exonuclease
VDFRKGRPQRRAATIQFARTNVSYVFHLPHCCLQWKRGILPPALRDYLLNPAIKKIGLNIGSDEKKLVRDFNISKVAGLVPLEPMGDAAFPNHRTGRWSLQRLVYWVLRRKLCKDPRLVFCDWEADSLQEDCIHYAVADAEAALQVYNTILSGVVLHPPSMQDRAVLAAEGDVDNAVASFLRDWARHGSAAHLKAFPEQFSCLVKLDPFHLLQRYSRALASKVDPLTGVFMTCMRDAVFITNKDDEARLKTYLKTARGMTDSEISKLPRSYYVSRCRRSIPSPAVLAARMQSVFELFKEKKMANGKPLFRQRRGREAGMEEVHLNCLGHVLRGCVSDPPDMPMYYHSKTRKNGLPVYRTVRGTSQLEGFHYHVRSKVPTWNLTPQSMDASVMEFVWAFNCKAGIESLGETDYGFFALDCLDYLVSSMVHSAAVSCTLGHSGALCCCLMHSAAV